MNLEELKKELKKVSDVADEIKGVHGIVAEKCKISTFYSQKIRKQTAAKTDNIDNRKLISKMIKYYRNELEKYARKIEVII